MLPEGNVNQAIRILSVAAFCLCLAAAAGAQETQQPVDETSLTIVDETAAENGASTSVFPYMLRMVLVLGLVVGAIYGLYALLKRSQVVKIQPDAPLKNLASLQLGPGKGVHVLALGEKAWLVGVTDSAVNLVAELNDKELIDELTLAAEKNAALGGTARTDFQGMLARLLKPTAGQKTTAVSKDFFSKQRDRLKKF